MHLESPHLSGEMIYWNSESSSTSFDANPDAGPFFRSPPPPPSALTRITGVSPHSPHVLSYDKVPQPASLLHSEFPTLFHLSIKGQTVAFKASSPGYGEECGLPHFPPQSPPLGLPRAAGVRAFPGTQARAPAESLRVCCSSWNSTFSQHMCDPLPHFLPVSARNQPQERSCWVLNCTPTAHPSNPSHLASVITALMSNGQIIHRSACFLFPSLEYKLQENSISS